MTAFLSRRPAPRAADGMRQALLADRTHALTDLYRQGFPPVRRYIGRRGGSVQDAQDVFQDAVVLLYEQAVGGTLVLTASASTYLLGISRNLWRHELRRRARLSGEVFTHELTERLAEAAEAPADPAAAVLAYVEQLGEKCRSILLGFYYFQQSLSQIAERQGYRSVRSATVQKFKCLERLRHAARTTFAAVTSAF